MTYQLLITFSRILVVTAFVLAWGQCVGASFGLVEVRKLVAEKRITSVEELLSNLPALYRSHYVLVFDSRSLQGASFENPRVIFYGPDGKFLLTFNGDPRDRGFDAIEMAEFDDAKEQFDFQEIVFPSADTPQGPATSELNPNRCSACHRVPGRPIWDAHPSWPGTFGESYRERPSAIEELGFEAFVRDQAAHSRYRYLIDIERFSYRYRFKPSAKEKYNALDVESPNAELTSLLSALNARTIAAALTRHPAFPTHRYAALAAVSRDCADIDELFPKVDHPDIHERFRQFSASSEAANQRELQSKQDRAQPQSIPSRFARASIDDADSLNKLRFVAEVMLGMNTANWTLALEKGTYDFTAPKPLIRDVEAILLKHVAREDPAVKDLSVYETQTSNNRYCSYLWNRNRASSSQTSDEKNSARQPDRDRTDSRR